MNNGETCFLCMYTQNIHSLCMLTLKKTLFTYIQGKVLKDCVFTVLKRVYESYKNINDHRNHQ